MEVGVVRQESPVEAKKETIPGRRSWIIGLTSFAFVLLQSACSAVMALSGLRLLIGVGSLAAAGSLTHLLDAIHGGRLRIPMTILALIGTFVNLYVIWRVRSLRARASSQWRKTTLHPEKKRNETIQLWISFMTLGLLIVEWIAHVHLFGNLVP